MVRYLCFALLLFLPVTYGAVFDKWVFIGDEFSFGNENFTAFSGNEEMLIIKSLNPSIPLFDIHINETIQIGPYLFFLSEIKYNVSADMEKSNITRLHGLDFYLKYKLSIKNQTSLVSATRTVTPNKIYYGDKTKITVTIKNSGAKLMGLSYKETLPSYLTLTGRPFMGKEESDYYWDMPVGEIYFNNINVNKSQQVVIGYYVTLSKTEENLSLNEARITIPNSGFIMLPRLKLALINPISLNVVSSASSGELSQEVKYTATIKNMDKDKKFQVKMEITLPANTEYVSGLDGFEQSEGKFLLEKQFLPGDDEKYEIITTASSVSNSSFDLTLSALDGDYVYTSNAVKPLIVTVSSLLISFLLDTYSSGSNVSKSLIVENRNKYLTYSNFQIKASSELFGEYMFGTDKIEPNSKSTLGNVSFTFPFTNIQKTYNVTLTGTYMSIDGEQKFKETKNVTVKAGSFKGGLDITIENLNGQNYIKITLSNQTEIGWAQLNFAGKEILLTDEQLTELSENKEILLLITEPINKTLKVQIDYGYHGWEYTKVMNVPAVAPLMKVSKPGDVEKNVKKTINLFANKETLFTPVGKMNVLLICSFVSIIVVVGLFAQAREKKKKKVVQKPVISTFKEIKQMPLQEEQSSAPKPGLNFDRIELFIKESRGKGKKDEEIKKELIAKGWMEDVADVYLKKIK